MLGLNASICASVLGRQRRKSATAMFDDHATVLSHLVLFFPVNDDFRPNFQARFVFKQVDVLNTKAKEDTVTSGPYFDEFERFANCRALTSVL